MVDSNNMTSRWRAAAGQIARALFPTAQITLCGDRYQVVYEARKHKADRDYPFLQALARGRRCLLDVGANLGLTALVMAKAAGPEASLYAFDASETACQFIQRNAQLNNLAEQIQVVNAVLGDRSGLTLPFYWDHAAGGASTIAGYLGHRIALNKVSLCLDDFVRQQTIQPDMIKVDVEGAEQQALRGAEQTLREHRPLVFVELHTWDTMPMVQNAAGVLSLAHQFGYRMVYLKTKQVLEDVAMLAQRGRCHVLLIPDAQPDPAWLSGFDTTGM